MPWFGRKRRSESRMEPEDIERIKKPNVQQGAAMQRPPSSSRQTARSRASQRTSGRSAGMKNIDLGKETTSDTSPGGTLSSGEQDFQHHKYIYFQRHSREDITALPGSRELDVSPHLRPATQDHADIPYNFHLHSTSHSSMPNPRTGPAKLIRNSSKRSAQDVALPKRKSTKRRKDEHIREEEIRAMSAPLSVNKRPGTYDSGILRRDTKRIRNNMNRKFERPESNVSLPMEDSLHSSLSDNSNPHAYHLSALDVIAPRPLIRSSFNAHLQAGLHQSPWVSRADSRQVDPRTHRKNLTPTKEILRGKKTVAELADDLDSSDIRAALERDQRRKEAKRQKEMERVKRKLERRAEKQRSKDAGTPVDESPGKRKRKDADRRGVGLGIESPQLTESESPKRKKKDLEKHLGTKITDSKILPRLQTTSDGEEVIKKETYLGYQRALQLNNDPAQAASDSIAEQYRQGKLSEADLANIHPAHRPQGSAPSLTQEPELITAASTPKQLSRQPTSPQQPPKESGSPETIEALPPLPSSPSKAEGPTSRSSSRRSSRGFISFFRRGPSLRKQEQERGRTTTPSDVSMSNASRESMPRSHLPPNIVSLPTSSQSQLPQSFSHTTSQNQGPAIPLPVGRTGSASTTTTNTTNTRQQQRDRTPVRTMSKFREDLPELPLSPPDSRMTSPVPESAGPSGALAIRRGFSSSGGRLHIEPGLPLPSEGSGSGAPSLNAEERAGRGANLMSTSLASVDSEASWLSGKPTKKPSVRRSARNSGASSSGLQKLAQTPSFEELGMAEDDYFRRLTPGPEDRKFSTHSAELGKKASSAVLASNTPQVGAEEEEDEDDVTENEEEFRTRSVQREEEEKDLKTGDVGKTPRLVQREQYVKSREGLMNEFLSHDESSAPEGLRIHSAHLTEEVETPDPISPATDNGTDTEGMPLATPEPVTVARASSIKMNREHESPKLLNIPARRQSGSTAASEAPTPRKLSRDATPVGRTSFEAASSRAQQGDENA